MSRRRSPSVGKVYEVRRVCQAWGVARSSHYARQSRRDDRVEKHRRGRCGFHTEDEIVKSIKQVLKDGAFCGEGYRKLWAWLRLRGVRTSRRGGASADATAQAAGAGAGG